MNGCYEMIYSDAYVRYGPSVIVRLDWVSDCSCRERQRVAGRFTGAISPQRATGWLLPGREEEEVLSGVLKKTQRGITKKSRSYGSCGCFHSSLSIRRSISHLQRFDPFERIKRRIFFLSKCYGHFSSMYIYFSWWYNSTSSLQSEFCSYTRTYPILVFIQR